MQRSFGHRLHSLVLFSQICMEQQIVRSSGQAKPWSLFFIEDYVGPLVPPMLGILAQFVLGGFCRDTISPPMPLPSTMPYSGPKSGVHTAAEESGWGIATAHYPTPRGGLVEGFLLNLLGSLCTKFLCRVPEEVCSGDA